MGSGVSRPDHTLGFGFISVRAVAYLSGDFHRTHSRLSYLRRLRLLPVLPFSLTSDFVPLLFLLNSFVWSLFVLALIGGLLGLCLGPKGLMRFYPLSISAVTDPILFYRFETRNLCYFLYPIGLFWNGYFFFFFKPRNEKELCLHWIELWFWEMGLFSIISKQVKLFKKVIFNRRIAYSR